MKLGVLTAIFDGMSFEEVVDFAAEHGLEWIAANNNQHHDLVCQAARAGKDIICETPVAMSVEELDDMIKVVEECGVKFTVHHQRRLDARTDMAIRFE